MDPDKDKNDQSGPGIPPPGKQLDQQQQPFAPPQPPTRQINMPSSGNPDLVPSSTVNPMNPMNPVNPLEPQGMLYDPRRLLDQQRAQRPDTSGVPPGARFDPFGPPDPDLVGPGRGPPPSAAFGVPDPDHFLPPGQPAPPSLARKSVKGLNPFPGPGGPGHLGGPGEPGSHF